MSPADYSHRFKVMILDPESWRRSARALLEAAALLEPRIDDFWRDVRSGVAWNDDSVAVYFMLCSFALENLLKARLVEQQQTRLRAALDAGLAFPKVLKGHDLYGLTQSVGLTALAEDEESLLRRLTRSAVWYGRYPVPVRPSDLASFHESSNKSFPISLTQYTSADRDDIKRLLRKLGWS